MYNSLNTDFSTIFETLVEHVESQAKDADRLRKELQCANQETMKTEERAAANLTAVLEEERREADEERTALMSQIGCLMKDMGDKQTARLERKVQTVQDDMGVSRSSIKEADKSYGEAMDKWSQEQDSFVGKVRESEKRLTSKIGSDLNVRCYSSLHYFADADFLLRRLLIRGTIRSRQTQVLLMGRLSELSTSKKKTWLCKCRL